MQLLVASMSIKTTFSVAFSLGMVMAFQLLLFLSVLYVLDVEIFSALPGRNSNHRGYCLGFCFLAHSICFSSFSVNYFLK